MRESQNKLEGREKEEKVKVVGVPSILMMVLLLSSGCAHSLEAQYGEGDGLGYALARESLQSQHVLGMRAPLAKDKYDEALAHSIIDALDRTGSFSRIVRNVSGSQAPGSQGPTVILDIQTNTNYSDDKVQNWYTQWPGVLLFSAWWNGLLYYMDIDTKVTATLAQTGERIEVNSRDRYHIHYASTVRGVFAGSIVGWIALTGTGFLCALIPTDWDENMKADANLKVRDEYGKIISQKVIKSLQGKM